MGDFDIPIIGHIGGIPVVEDDRIPMPGKGSNYSWFFEYWNCEYCGAENWSMNSRCFTCRFRRGPDDVWRVIGKLGPRADGRTYYIYGNEATGEIVYKWKVEFWQGTGAILLGYVSEYYFDKFNTWTSRMIEQIQNG